MIKKVTLRGGPCDKHVISIDGDLIKHPSGTVDVLTRQLDWKWVETVAFDYVTESTHTYKFSQYHDDMQMFYVEGT